VFAMAKRKKRTDDSLPMQLKALRKRLGLTQAEAAERIHVTRTSWSFWEAGMRTPSQRTLFLIQLLKDGKI
jgi:DNA-binding transcriptional regulator YiaG